MVRTGTVAPSLSCRVCGCDLLVSGQPGLVVLCSRRSLDALLHYEDVYWACKGTCDRKLRHRARQAGLHDAWTDILDLKIPHIFLTWAIDLSNKLRSGVTFADTAFEDLKIVFAALFPHVARDMSPDEEGRLRELLEEPLRRGLASPRRLLYLVRG